MQFTAFKRILKKIGDSLCQRVSPYWCFIIVLSWEVGAYLLAPSFSSFVNKETADISVTINTFSALVYFVLIYSAGKALLLYFLNDVIAFVARAVRGRSTKGRLLAR